jgi:hypothetical protein
MTGPTDDGTTCAVMTSPAIKMYFLEMEYIRVTRKISTILLSNTFTEKRLTDDGTFCGRL